MKLGSSKKELQRFLLNPLFNNTTIVIIKKHVIHHEGHEGHEVHKTSNGIDGASFFKYCLRELRGKKLLKARFIGFYNSLVSF
jgi:hypothetical protein